MSGWIQICGSRVLVKISSKLILKFVGEQTHTHKLANQVEENSPDPADAPGYPGYPSKGVTGQAKKG